MFRNQKEFERFGHFVYDADKGGGNTTPLTEEAVNALFDARLAKTKGDGTELARLLFGENYTLREQKRILEGKVSPDGAVILTGDDAKAWAEYQALGKPSEVKQGLEQRTQLQGELEGVKRETLLLKVADAAKFKYSALVDRDKVAKIDGKALTFEVRDVEKDGVKTPTAFVKDGEVEKPLLDYAQAHWADYMPVLLANPNTTTTTTSSGTRIIKQQSGSGDGKAETSADVAKETLSRGYSRLTKKAQS